MTLGPLLFLIYINDIGNSSAKFNFYLFADDTNLLYADKDLKSLENVFKTELNLVSNWLRANYQKSNFIIFRPYQESTNYDLRLKIYDYTVNVSVSLENKDYVKYLGILLDSKLT